MASEDTKDDQEALDALELEAKEFDKASLTRPLPQISQMFANDFFRMQRSIAF